MIQALCQGSAEEQKHALQTYFQPDAAFQHPLCRVPSLSCQRGSLFRGGEVNSRMMIMAIYRWYRLLSPKIDFKINSIGMRPGVSLAHMHVVFGRHPRSFIVPVPLTRNLSSL